MTRRTPHAVALLLVALSLAAARGVAAQDTRTQPAGEFRPVMLRLPKGYMPAPAPHKRAGQLLLDAKRPAGMYIIYPKDEAPDAFNAFLKTMVAGMFTRDENAKLTWAESPLPAVKGIDDESGTLYTASDEKMDIQLAAFTRTVGGTKVAYGYYARRQRDEGKKDDTPFLDGSGKGVKAFEEFRKSIRASK